MTTTPNYAESVYAQERRTAKAVRLEAHLATNGWSSGEVAATDPGTRRELERQAGVRRCSDETWGLIVRLMRSAEDRLRHEVTP